MLKSQRRSSSPKVPATLNGILSYHSENYCVNANLILGRDISESTQVGFYFNDQLKCCLVLINPRFLLDWKIKH